MKKICIIDFETSNLKSIYSAFKILGYDPTITNNIMQIHKSDALVLPGIGAFPKVMKFLNRTGISKEIKLSIKNRKPFLGICLGMQLLFDKSLEFKSTNGLKILKGNVISLNNFKSNNLTVPNTGWFKLERNNNTSIIPKKVFCYFTHSFFVENAPKSIISSYITLDKKKICSSIQSKNIHALQFHPEKSGPKGLEIIKNFCKLI